MKIIIKPSFLVNTTQALFIETIDEGELLLEPSMIDLDEMFKGKYSALESHCLTYALPQVFSSTGGLSGFDAFRVFKMLVDSEDLIEETADFWLSEWGLGINSDYENDELDSIVGVIETKASYYMQMCQGAFDTAKEAIVSQATDCSLSGDKNELDLSSLYEYGSNLVKKFRSDEGNVIFEYNSDNATWESAEGFELPVGENGMPYNDDLSSLFELDNGNFVKISSFTEVT